MATLNAPTTEALKQAILAARAAGGQHTINLRAGATYQLNTVYHDVGSPPINGHSGLPRIQGCQIFINGNNAIIERISSEDFRIFHIVNGAKLEITNLALRNGRLPFPTLPIPTFPATFGGAIYNSGQLIVRHCILENNQADYGGAIYNGSFNDAKIYNSTLRLNKATEGGAIWNWVNGKLWVECCLVTDNEAGRTGGIESHGQTTVTQSYFIYNRATASTYVGLADPGPGGGALSCRAGVLNVSSTEIRDNEMSGNAQGKGAGAIYVSLGQATLTNNLIYKNKTNDSSAVVVNTTGTPVKAFRNWWGSNNGPGGVGPGSGDSISTNVTYTPYITTANNENIGPQKCDVGQYSGAGAAQTSNPVSLLDGEKRFDDTDLSLTTPYQPLQLIRSYRQNSQTNPDFQFMGLGWTHNHVYHLVVTPIVGQTSYEQLEVTLPGGSQLKLYEDAQIANRFTPALGATSVIIYDPVMERYTLTTTDQNQYIFALYQDGATTAYLLMERIWPNGKKWTYSYTALKLLSVQDTYGNQLTFTYYSGGDYRTGQLERVTDHTARFIEFDYTPEKIAGVTVSNPKALLAQVTDVRGYKWHYIYYGQASIDTNNANLNNKFVARRSPPLVSADPLSRITLEQVSYGFVGALLKKLTQGRGIAFGDMPLEETEFTFYVNNEAQTKQKTAEQVTTHFFDRAVYLGTADPAGHSTQQVNAVNFRPIEQVDANGNTTALLWSGDGKQLNAVTDAIGNTTEFIYDSDSRLTQSIDAEGQVTQYTYESAAAPRQPTRVKVLKNSVVQRWQEFAYDTDGHTLSEKTLDPINGATILQEVTRTYVPSGNGTGLLQSVVQKDIGGSNDVSTTYTYDELGRVKKVQQSSNFGSCDTSFTLYDAAGNVLVSICNYNPGASSDPTTVAQAIGLFNPQNPAKNNVTTHDYDAMGRRISTTSNAGANWAQTSFTVYDALSRVVLTVQNYNVPAGTPTPEAWIFENGMWRDGEAGIPISHGEGNNQNLISAVAYNARGLLRWQQDTLGHVTLMGYDTADRLVKTVQNASDIDYDNDYTYNDQHQLVGDPDLSSYDPNDTADQDIITRQVYDAVGNLVQSIDTRNRSSFTVYDVLNRPVRTVQNAKASATIALNVGDPGYDPHNDPRSFDNPHSWETNEDYEPSVDADRDQISETRYDAMGRVIRTRRLMDSRVYSKEWDVTLYGYDDLGQQVRTIQHASAPDYNIANDPDLSDYPLSGALDQDHLTRTEYDATGRALNTIDMSGRLTRQVYDGLGRVTRTITNYVPQGTPVVEPNLWQWNTTAARWELPNGTPIEYGLDFDQNRITNTEYDLDGRVAFTRSAAGRVSTNGYDTQGRSIISVQNFVNEIPAYAERYDWRWINGAWMDKASGGVVIQGGAGFDQNRVGGTTYDDQGRVLFTRDALGQVTRSLYDSVGRQTRTIQNYNVQTNVSLQDVDPVGWRWNETGHQWEFLYDVTGPIWNSVNHGTANDQNLISDTTYDLLGRVISTRDTVGRKTRAAYDSIGRRIIQVMNYTAPSDPAFWKWDEIDGRWEYRPDPMTSVPITHGTQNDENLISQTVYDKAGQVLNTRDARGTQTTMTYDAAGRTREMTGTAGTALATSSYVNYDKAGRVLRRIINYIPQPDISPETHNGVSWDFNPETHGRDNDQNIITISLYDRASRAVKTIDALGHTMETLYRKDGQIDTTIDPLGVKTVYRYDSLGRRVRVVQNYRAPASMKPNLATPENWRWENDQWEFIYDRTSGTPPTDVWQAVSHGAQKDQNIIVVVSYNAEGQISSQRNPRGAFTSYTYDALGRRISLTNPLSTTWLTAFTEANGTTRTTQTLPGMATGGTYTVTRDFDYLGRLISVQSGSPTTTPDIRHSYSLAGDRVQMAEFGATNFTALVRQTDYNYDAAHRLTSASFDDDGSGTPDNTVGYVYNVSGRRTQMTLPNHPTLPTNPTLDYVYDAQGRLVQMTDWAGQITRWRYDQVSRPTLMLRPQGEKSQRRYDAASRLTRLRHYRDDTTRLQFDYALDARGNRTRRQELTRKGVPAAETRTLLFDDAALAYTGTWQDDAPFKTTSDSFAVMRVMAVGHTLTFTYGTGPDHGRFDVYVNHTLWESFDGYTLVADEVTVIIPLTEEGWNSFEIRNTSDKAAASSGITLRFKSLMVESQDYQGQIITYTYDGVSRLAAAEHDDASRHYAYVFDVAGNRTQEQVTIGITTTTTHFTYNAANQMTARQIGVDTPLTLTYDPNGNMISDGVMTYTWNRANRLAMVNNGLYNTHYAYDGNNNRRSQTIDGIVTQYLLDTQPSLALVLRETTPTQSTHYTHGPMGVETIQQDSNWSMPLVDGLGSVRSELDAFGQVAAAQQYDPYGQTYDETGDWIGSFAFTGEQRDTNSLQYHRARYYNPSLGILPSLDPFEGMQDRPMSLNGYGWVEGNPVNAIDASGMQMCLGFDPFNPLKPRDAIECQDYCWQEYDGDATCLASCAPFDPANYSSIVNSSVVVAYGGWDAHCKTDPYSGCCPTNPSGCGEGKPTTSSFMGTLSTSPGIGLWTHTHFDKIDTTQLSTPQHNIDSIRGKVLDAGLPFSGLVDYMKIYGQKGFLIVPIHKDFAREQVNIGFDSAFSSNRALLMTAPELNAYNIQRIATPINAYTNAFKEGILKRNSIIVNANINIGGGGGFISPYANWANIGLTVSRILTPANDFFLKPRGFAITHAIVGHPPLAGNSGSGFFKRINGMIQLIGILQAEGTPPGEFPSEKKVAYLALIGRGQFD